MDTTEMKVSPGRAGFVAAIDALLREPVRAAAMADAARARVLVRYTWNAHLSRIDRYLDVPVRGHANAA